MTAEERFWKLVNKTDNCWTWIGMVDPDGYGRFKKIATRKNTVRTAAHRFSYEITYGAIEPGKLICHKCDNPSCVRPDHLFSGTPLENQQDMTKKGRGRIGCKNGRYSHGRRCQKNI